MEVKEVSINYTLNRPVLIEDTINFCKLAKKKIQTLNLEVPKLLIDKIIFYSHKRKTIIKGHITIIKEEKSIEEYLRICNENLTGTTSIMSWNHGRYPSNNLRFESEIKI